MSLPFVNRIGQLAYRMTLNLGLSNGFSRLDSGYHFQQQRQRMDIVSLHPVGRHMVLPCPVTGHVNCDYFIKVI